MRQVSRLDLLLLVIAGLGTVLMTAIWAGDPDTVDWFAREDGPIENLTVILYGLSFIVCLSYSIRSQASIKYYLILWAILSLVFLGEESSWLQRWLGFPTPEFLPVDNKGEFNIHNLKWWTPRQVTGPVDFLTSQGVFYLGYLVYFLVVPSTIWLNLAPRLQSFLQFPMPPGTMLLAIWLPITISIFLTLVSEIGMNRGALTETREMYFAFSIFLYTLFLAYQAARRRR